MVNWRIMFSKPVLESGKRAFQDGRVRSLRKIGDMYTASISDDDDVRFVMIDLRGDAIHAECDCGYGGRGIHCKHMAATLFAIEDKYAQNTAASQKIVRLFTPKECSACHFDLSRLTQGWVFTESVCQKAQQMINDGTVRLTLCETDYDTNGKEMLNICGVYGSLEGGIFISCYADRVFYMRCFCQKNQYTNGLRPCAHLTALLMLAQKHIAAYDPGDGTPLHAWNLLHTFRSAVPTDDALHTRMNEIIRLEPHLSMDDQKLYLSFRIGGDKWYRLRNVNDLIRAYDAEGTVTFGKSILDFSFSRFDETSQWYFDLIHRTVNDARRTKTVLKETIPLDGWNLDAFFDFLSGKTVLLDDEYRGKDEIRLCEKNIPWDLFIMPRFRGGRILEGVSLTGSKPACFSGDRYNYGWIPDEKVLCRISAAQQKMIRLLCSEKGTVDFYFGKKRLPGFYRHILPALEQVAHVEQTDRESVMEQVPPAVEFTFYLDAAGKKIFCSVEAAYGEKKFRLTPQEEALEGFRDGETEKEAIRLVRSYFPQTENDVFVCEKEDHIFRILESGVNDLLGWGQVQATDSFRGLKICRKVSVKVGLSVQSDLLSLKIESDELDESDIQAFLNSYRQKKKYHRLRNGDFVQIDESLGELGTVMDALHLTGEQLTDAKLPLYRAVYLNELLREQDGLYIQRDEHFTALIDRFEEAKAATATVPGSLKDIMRPYQTQGYQWLRTLEQCGFGGILADDMGLGKTLQMIAVLLARKEEGKTGTSLITTPASLVYNWFSELERFAPALKVGVIAGTQAARQRILDRYEAYDVLVTSYDLLKRDITLYENKHFAFHVLDEAQYIKNQGTTAARSVKVIASETRIALTGTPIENRVSELWSIFDFLMPGYLYEYPLFREEMEEPIIRFEDEDATLRLKKMIAPFILRRLKQDVLKDLPEKLEEVRLVQAEGKQRKLYDALATQMRDFLTKTDTQSFNKQKIEVLAQITRLRQICCDPSLLYENYDGDSAKRALCMDLIETAIEGEHRILLFSQFTSMLTLLQKDLDERKIEYFLLTGSTPKKERQRLVEAFNSGTTPVFLISLRAGGTGLNLTGADVVIHYDPWWNVAVQDQATDRAHRIGQEKVVSVYQLLTKNTIEEKIRLLQEKKHDLADALLSGEAVSLMSMSREDLLELL